MNKKIVEKMIEDMAKEIKRECIGAKFYGLELDLNNPDHLLVAAYYLGNEEGDK